ncbi:hypothetical protein [Azohydromonas lata]|uniref:DUF4124 domain-containing protein n=1 Tax=Azohydromonas lata TaxID=45677 RepID=A0ABU5IKH6_9BURK|nr:hypothetical protein [Azohydromonas lata]MDZ5459385.1 hypothetical protein [Azohydromonas lata]
MKHTSRALLHAALLLSGAAAQAQGSTTVYRCPGPPILYTDAISAQQARARGCQAVDASPVTISGTRPHAASRATPPATGVASATAAAASGTAPVVARPAERVTAPQQRERDNDARAILQAELQREQTRLQQLLAEYNDGQPERLGHERNNQRYLDRVAALKASIERSSADIAALQRELARLSRP